MYRSQLGLQAERPGRVGLLLLPPLAQENRWIVGCSDECVHCCVPSVLWVVRLTPPRSVESGPLRPAPECRPKRARNHQRHVPFPLLRLYRAVRGMSCQIDYMRRVIVGTTTGGARMNSLRTNVRSDD